MPDSKAAWRERAAFLERAEGLTPIVAADTESGRFLLSTSDENITPPLFLKRSRGEIRALRRAMAALDALGARRRGGTLVDVGANIGTTTVSALNQHGFDRAVACEPEPRNVRLLELNLVANDLGGSATVCKAAVGDSDGEIDLVIARNQFGLHEVRSKGRPSPSWPNRARRTATVPQVTLDTLAREGAFDPDDVSLLWMDVQGHEGQVLRGARSLTARGIPVVLELDPEALKRHGGLSQTRRTILERYTHFVPLRGGVGEPANLVVVPVKRLARVIEGLRAEGRFTDVLLVRDPVDPPTPQAPFEIAGSIPGKPATRRRRKPRAPDAIETVERRDFVRRARGMSPLIAAELERATFVVRTAPGSAELPLFVHRSHPRLRRLNAAVMLLDALGLRRHGTFVEVGAGPGISSVAALAWHGFSRAVASEQDREERRMLELNLAANRLSARADVLDRQIALDRLAGKKVIRSDEVGLLWIEDVRATERALAGARALLRTAPPLVLRLEPGAPVSEFLRTGALSEAYTHFARLSSSPSPPKRARLLPIDALPGLVDGVARRAVHVLVLRLPPGERL
jgi:FkbM family methyltransferase